MQAGRIDRGLATTEIVLAIGMILIAGLFLASIDRLTGKSADMTNTLDVEETADRIARFLEESGKGDLYVNVCVTFPSAEVWIKDSVLYVKRGDKVASRPLTGDWYDEPPIFTDHICMTSEKNAFFHGYNPNCKNDGSCTPEECKDGCPDCDGPNPACIGDGECVPNIGESCQNSPDCACSSGYYCCPRNPSSDSQGCVVGTGGGKTEGEECYCNEECSGSLVCTTTSVSFPSYYYACCPPGSSWDGASCVPADKIRILFVPVNWQGSRESFEKAAREQFAFFILNSGIDLKNCPSRAKYYADFDATKCTVSSLGAYSCNPGSVLVGIQSCATGLPASYNYIAGLTDREVCGSKEGFTIPGFLPVVFAETSGKLITAHEIGHQFGLNDEYVDICKCADSGYFYDRDGTIKFGKCAQVCVEHGIPYTSGDENANCLNPSLGGDEELPGLTDGLCAGSLCPTSYDPTCWGNNNSAGGRCIMSFANAPGPRMFCQECLNHLDNYNILKCT